MFSTMTRLAPFLSASFSLCRAFRRHPTFLVGRGLAQDSSPGGLPAGWTPPLLEEAKLWISEFRKTKTVPKQHVDVSFARSSGPGGQVRIQVGKIWIPSYFGSHQLTP